MYVCIYMYVILRHKKGLLYFIMYLDIGAPINVVRTRKTGNFIPKGLELFGVFISKILFMYINVQFLLLFRDFLGCF